MFHVLLSVDYPLAQMNGAKVISKFNIHNVIRLISLQSSTIRNYVSQWNIPEADVSNARKRRRGDMYTEKETNMTGDEKLHWGKSKHPE